MLLRRFVMVIGACLLPLLAGRLCYCQDSADYRRISDVIYGRKYGTALTLDVFEPKAKANGLGVVLVISGGWFSSHQAIHPGLCAEFLGRGYTVFAVVHGSQPKYTIPEILEDMHRAVRFVRHHAGRYGIDAGRIGIAGGSAGGHLSLMQGVAGQPGNQGAADPVERESSRVQAVACFFPPTDFLNYGKPGQNALETPILANFRAPFDFHRLDEKTKSFVPVTDKDRIRQILRDISPIYQVSPDDPPTLIIHGDADKLVPIQQAKIMVGKLQEAGVPTKLVVRHGAGHGWRTLAKDTALLADWFDQYLKRPAKKPGK